MPGEESMTNMSNIGPPTIVAIFFECLVTVSDLLANMSPLYIFKKCLDPNPENRREARHS
jgi:hypothetical protein